MIRTPFLVFAIAVSAIVTASASPAKPALKDVAFVREGIIATGIAVEISKKCSSLKPRYLRGIGYLNTLKNHAAGLGYSDSEIDAYTNDKAEERRLTAVARARLAQMGAVDGDEASYCAVGRSEMARNSAIGRLLR